MAFPFGVPDRIAVPSGLSTSDNPVGKVPFAEIDAKPEKPAPATTN